MFLCAYVTLTLTFFFIADILGLAEKIKDNHNSTTTLMKVIFFNVSWETIKMSTKPLE